MEKLSANKGLMLTLVTSAALLCALLTDLVPDLYAYLELSPLPSQELRSELLGLMFLDSFLCWFLELLASKIFRF